MILKMKASRRFPIIPDPELMERWQAEERQLRTVFTDEPTAKRAGRGLALGLSAYALAALAAMVATASWFQ